MILDFYYLARGINTAFDSLKKKKTILLSTLLCNLEVLTTHFSSLLTFHLLFDPYSGWQLIASFDILKILCQSELLHNCTAPGSLAMLQKMPQGNPHIAIKMESRL